MRAGGGDSLGRMQAPGDDAEAGQTDESRVEVYVTSDTSAAPHKAGESKLYVMYDAAQPDGDKLYFTEAEWEAFLLGVKDGEFDLDESGNLPDLDEPGNRP
jgi:Domain of unknown function (DUF397)